MIKEYWENGNLKSEYYDENGNLSLKENYKNGELPGEELDESAHIMMRMGFGKLGVAEHERPLKDGKSEWYDEKVVFFLG